MLDCAVSKTKVTLHVKISKNPFLGSDATYKCVTFPYQLNMEFYLNYIKQFSSYLTENTDRVHYKHQSVLLQEV